MIGPVELELFVSSTAEDRDFTGALVDVHPDGRAELISDGILRVRYRNGPQQPTLMRPGEVYRLRVGLSSTAIVFAAGHRIRLHVTSSSFPRFDRHPNTGGVLSRTGPEDRVAATNTVHHDSRFPSRLVLPVVPLG